MAIDFDAMFVLATAAFAWGLSLVSYRWFARHNGWAMGAWQAAMPAVPQAIGVAVVALAVGVAIARGPGTAVLVLVLGLAGAAVWTLLLKVGAQSALLLGPLAAALVRWRLGGV